MTMNNTAQLAWGKDCEAVVNRHAHSIFQSTKECVRHLLFKSGLSVPMHWVQANRGFRSREFLCDDVAETFAAIYRLGGWIHAADQESSSGIGSSLAITDGLVEAISLVMARLGCHSLVDIGCGDWNWFGKTPFSFDYTGIDIVPDVIAANQRFERPNVRFAVVDAIRDPLPRADVALCREMLFHLSFAHARKVIAGVKEAAKYLIATTDLDLWFNSDIQTGDFRRINLLRRPYAFPSPLCLIPDNRLVPARRLAVWETATLPE